VLDQTTLVTLACHAPNAEILCDILAALHEQDADVSGLDPDLVTARLTGPYATTLLELVPAGAGGRDRTERDRSRALRALIIRLTDDPALLRALAEEALDADEPGEDHLALFDHPCADPDTRMLALAVSKLAWRVDLDTGRVTGDREVAELKPGPELLADIQAREQRVLNDWFARPPSAELAERLATCRAESSTQRRPDGKISATSLRLPSIVTLYAAHPLLDQASTLAVLRAGYRDVTVPEREPSSGRRSEPHHRVVEAAREILDRDDLVQVLSRTRDGGTDPALLAGAVTEIVDHAEQANWLGLMTAVRTLALVLPADEAGLDLLRYCCRAPWAWPQLAARTDVPAGLLADLASSLGGGPFPVPGASGPTELTVDRQERVSDDLLRLVVIALADNPVTPGCVLRALPVSITARPLARLLTDTRADRSVWAAATRLEPPQDATAGQWLDVLTAVATT